MDRLLSVFADLSDARIGGGDSFTDRLSNRYTTFLLVILSIVITTNHYVGEPISCWCPAHFTSSHIDYTNKVCWTTNTFYLPVKENTEIPANYEEVKRIGYYQWVALILCAMAMLFYLPRPLWRVFNKQSGVAVSTITDAAIDCQRQRDPEARDKTLKYMINHVSRFLKEVTRKHMTAKCRTFWWKLYGNYLTMLYLCFKLIYLGNVIGQLFLLNVFLGTDYNMYGFKVLKQIINKEPWDLSERFPRVTMCDFNIRVVGNVQSYLVQCTLPINLFNEKIFIVIWFWYVFVASATTASLVVWITKSFYMTNHESYIKKRLIAIDKYHGKAATRASLKHFTNHYLRRDGCFMIRMVAKNTSDLISAELIAGLWEMYGNTRYSIFRFESYEAEALKMRRESLREDPAADVPDDADRKEYDDGESKSDQDLVKRKLSIPPEES